MRAGVALIDPAHETGQFLGRDRRDHHAQCGAVTSDQIDNVQQGIFMLLVPDRSRPDHHVFQVLPAVPNITVVGKIILFQLYLAPRRSPGGDGLVAGIDEGNGLHLGCGSQRSLEEMPELLMIVGIDILGQDAVGDESNLKLGGAEMPPDLLDKVVDALVDIGAEQGKRVLLAEPYTDTEYGADGNQDEQTDCRRKRNGYR